VSHEDDVPKAARPDRQDRVALTVYGFVILACFVVLAVLSHRHDFSAASVQRPILYVVAILMCAGAAYLASVFSVLRISGTRRLFVGILAAGLIYRAVMLFSEPVLEDDYFRYLWEGGVTAHGFSPYLYSPHEVNFSTVYLDVPEALCELGTESGGVLQRVNHPELSTVYPPVTQAVFALAHVLRPWSLTAWRMVLLAVELLTLGLLVLALKRLGKPAHLSLIYWWNPLVIKETINSAHMDVLALPLVLAALLLVMASKPARSAALLALGVGVKVWPIILFPILCRSFCCKRAGFLSATLVLVLLIAILFAPFVSGMLGAEESGFAVYSDRWEMNDGLFMGFLKGAEWGSAAFGLGDMPRSINRAARVLALLALLVWIALVARAPIRDHRDVCNRIVLVLGAAFLISPTQYPWYYVWMVPFLALSPRPSMLLLTFTLPMYYALFYLERRQNIDLFHHGIVWLEYVPVYALVVWELVREFRNRQTPEVN